MSLGQGDKELSQLPAACQRELGQTDGWDRGVRPPRLPKACPQKVGLGLDLVVVDDGQVLPRRQSDWRAAGSQPFDILPVFDARSEATAGHGHKAILVADACHDASNFPQMCTGVTEDRQLHPLVLRQVDGDCLYFERLGPIQAREHRVRYRTRVLVEARYYLRLSSHDEASAAQCTQTG